MNADRPRSRSRRSLLRAGAAAGGLSVIGSLAGCSGLFGTDGDEGRDEAIADRLTNVPAAPEAVRGSFEMRQEAISEEVSSELLRGAVAYADVSSLADDPAVAALGRFPSPSLQAPGFQAAVEVVRFMGASLVPPHDPGAINEMCSLGPVQNVFLEPTGVYWADWEESSLVATIEETQSFDGFAERTYEGYTMYEPEGRNQYVPAIGVLSDDLYTVGPPSAVRTVIDVDRGADQSLDDPYRSEIETETEGAVRCTIRPIAGHFLELDPAVFEPIERALGSYVIDGDDRTISAEFTLTDATEAEELGENLDTLLADSGDGQESDPPVAGDYGALSVTTDGPELQVRYETSVAAIEELGRDLR